MGSIHTITVVGAGATGWQVAYLVARGCYRTVLEDISGQRIGAALEALRDTTEAEVRAGRLDPAGATDLLARVIPETALDRAVSEADLVIEAAPDDLETKTEVYTILNLAARPSCVFATVSAGWPVAEIAALTYRAPLVVGMRLAAPLLGARQIEIVAGPETAAHAIAAIEELAHRVGEQVVIVHEPAGRRAGIIGGIELYGTPKHQAGKP